MVIALFLLVLNYFISRLLIRLTVRLSKIYIENSQILASTVRGDVYEFYLKVYENPKCLDNILIIHLPIFNLYHCHTVYTAILNAEIKIKQ
jgi:hypothetical protein